MSAQPKNEQSPALPHDPSVEATSILLRDKQRIALGSVAPKKFSGRVLMSFS